MEIHKHRILGIVSTKHTTVTATLIHEFEMQKIRFRRILKPMTDRHITILTTG